MHEHYKVVAWSRLWAHPIEINSSTQIFMSVECCFTSTETLGLLGMGARDSHLNFHTAPQLWDVCVNGRMFSYFDLAELKGCDACVCMDYINIVWQTSELFTRSEERATVPDTLLLPLFLYRERNSQQLKTMPHVYVEWPIKSVIEAPSLLRHPSLNHPSYFSAIKTSWTLSLIHISEPTRHA